MSDKSCPTTCGSRTELADARHVYAATHLLAETVLAALDSQEDAVMEKAIASMRSVADIIAERHVRAFRVELASGSDTDLLEDRVRTLRERVETLTEENERLQEEVEALRDRLGAIESLPGIAVALGIDS